MPPESELPCGLDDVLITQALSERAPHEPDAHAEDEAYQALARQMADRPEGLLQVLMQTALRLCQAGSAGVSLLEPTIDDKEVFRWVALAGVYAEHQGGTTPRDFSPCGTCLDSKSPQLYSYPARHFTYLNGVQPPIVEGLVIPFGTHQPILGTVWIVSHDESRQFDREDVRVMTGLADFTAAALTLCGALKEKADVCQALKDADRRKDEFMAVLAHELRNPLAPVRNAVEILRIKGPAVPELEWARGVIDRQIQQMGRLIDDLLDLSRIARNKLELRTEPVALETVLQGAIETSRPMIEQHRHEFIVSLPPTPLILNADLTRLAQVFSNLLNNAAKFTEPGGRISLTAERQGSDAVISVRDTGSGIAPEMLPCIFGMYMQADRTIERSEGGLGIGLALVKRLVELQGGSIEARSDGVGKGSEFVVRLPVDLTSQQQRIPAGPQQPILASNFRILVVDDNRDAADSLGMLLRVTGNQPRIAYDGSSALLAAEEFRPHVVLLDIGLPRLNGHEVARQIRQQTWGAQMVLIALTGWAQDEDKQRSKDAGFDYHMVKPVDGASLMKLLAGLPTAATENV